MNRDDDFAREELSLHGFNAGSFAFSSAPVELHASGIRAALSLLEAGSRVLLSGEIYLARDAAHKKMFRLLDEGEALPFPILDSCIYYCGPTAAPPGAAAGSCGPTTAGRMDKYVPRLISLGLAGMIGKGDRDEKVISAMKEHGCVYFVTPGGCGAYFSSFVKSLREIAFLELGCESVKKMEIEGLPLIVGIDSKGNDFLRENRKLYAH